MRYRRSGFTLIELMVVIIIIGVLALVATSMISGHIKKARKAEAVTAMGTIYAAERKYYAEWGGYLDVPITGEARSSAYHSLGIDLSDLDGVYFSNNCYHIDLSSGQFIVCEPQYSTAPKKGEVNNEPAMWIYPDGSIHGY